MSLARLTNMIAGRWWIGPPDPLRDQPPGVSDRPARSTAPAAVNQPPGAVNQPPPPRRLLKARAREAGASGAAIEDLDDAADPKVRAARARA
jgi:hypothetical protein